MISTWLSLLIASRKERGIGEKRKGKEESDAQESTGVSAVQRERKPREGRHRKKRTRCLVEEEARAPRRSSTSCATGCAGSCEASYAASSCASCRAAQCAV